MWDNNVIIPVFTIGGWIIGALIVVIGMREQVKNLTKAINDLREDLDIVFDKINRHEGRISFIEGRYGRRPPQSED